MPQIPTPLHAFSFGALYKFNQHISIIPGLISNEFIKQRLFLEKINVSGMLDKDLLWLNTASTSLKDCKKSVKLFLAAAKENGCFSGIEISYNNICDLILSKFRYLDFITRYFDNVAHKIQISIDENFYNEDGALPAFSHPELSKHTALSINSTIESTLNDKIIFDVYSGLSNEVIKLNQELIDMIATIWSTKVLPIDYAIDDFRDVRTHVPAIQVDVDKNKIKFSLEDSNHDDPSDLMEDGFDTIINKYHGCRWKSGGDSGHNRHQYVFPVFDGIDLGHAQRHAAIAALEIMSFICAIQKQNTGDTTGTRDFRVTVTMVPPPIDPITKSIKYEKDIALSAYTDSGFVEFDSCFNDTVNNIIQNSYFVPDSYPLKVKMHSTDNRCSHA